MKALNYFIKKNTWLSREEKYNTDFGWGNGYIVIPKGHKLYNLHYNEIHDLLPSLECNGGLTFSSMVKDLKEWDEVIMLEDDMYIIGFDTCHSWDTLENKPREEVIRLTEKLYNDINNLI